MITPRQRELRRSHLGSSDMPALVGVDPYRTAADVWLQKTADIAETGSGASLLGQVCESAALQLAAKELGVRLDRRNTYRVSKQDPVFAANVDGLVTGLPWAIEAKTTGLTGPTPEKEMWGEPGTDEVPERVIVQCQHQMFVADLEQVWVAAVIGQRGFVLYRVPRNEQLIAHLRGVGSHFWHQHVEPKVAPPGSVPSLELLQSLRRQPNKLIELDAALVRSWSEARDQRLAAEKREEEVKRELLAALGDAEAADCPMGRLTYLEQSRASIDAKRLRAERPEIADEFASESSYRVLRFKQSNNGKGKA